MFYHCLFTIQAATWLNGTTHRLEILQHRWPSDKSVKGRTQHILKGGGSKKNSIQHSGENSKNFGGGGGEILN